MTAMKALRAAGLAMVVSLGLVLSGSPAAADPGGVPPAVAKWFTQDVPQVAGGVLGTGAVGLGPEQPANGYQAGSPVRLHRWNPDFVAGGSSQAVVTTDEWVAALYRDGGVVGTIAGALSPAGQVAMSYVDDDVAAGKALASRTVIGQLVQDPRMGGLVEVKPGGAAEGLSVTADSAVASVDETTELRKAVAKAHSPASWDSTETGGGAAGTTEGGDQSSFVLVFLLSGAVLWFAWRRAPGHQRS